MKDGPISDAVAGLTACRVWTGALDRNGYGQFRTVEAEISRWYSAHRYSFFLKTGRHAIKPVLQRCRNRSCVNPEHLYEGDRRFDTMRRGQAHGLAVLTEELVEQAILRHDGGHGQPVTSIAREYGVNESTLRRAVTGKTWRFLCSSE